jgi:hypothetical protein
MSTHTRSPERLLLLDSLERTGLHYAAKKRLLLAASTKYYAESDRSRLLNDESDPKWVVYKAAIDARNRALEAFEHAADALLAYDSELHPAATEPAPANDPDKTVAP